MRPTTPAGIPTISGILYSCNPRPDYLQATLDSLRRQYLPSAAWELILKDNNSQPPLATQCDLGWHPHARIIAETNQGLAPARRRGNLESSA